MKRTPLTSDAQKRREFQQRAQANSSHKRKPISPASEAQRQKVRDQACVECAQFGGCDPAHLTPRAQGGCDDAACVIALCRSCHRDFDDGRLDLAPLLALSQFSVERSHMASHMSFPAAMRRLTGRLA